MAQHATPVATPPIDHSSGGPTAVIPWSLRQRFRTRTVVPPIPVESVVDRPLGPDLGPLAPALGVILRSFGTAILPSIAPVGQNQMSGM
jgi:hypothetical protein